MVNIILFFKAYELYFPLLLLLLLLLVVVVVVVVVVNIIKLVKRKIILQNKFCLLNFLPHGRPAVG